MFSMRLSLLSPLLYVCCVIWQTAASQPATINYNSQSLFLNGANLAWMSFANDVGPGQRDFGAFADVLCQLHNHGGNMMRWWVHTNGAVTPAFNDTGLVIGPGPGTIESLRKVLDLAWEREIGLDLCLWSFDMLRSTNDAAVLDRNLKLLTDTAYTRAYIDNCLIPIVDSLRHHPAILCWEIFNEAEGMSNEFYFTGVDPHLPMSTIQRFINLCAGAIHREDAAALVTNGAWSFKSLTDVPAPLTKVGNQFDEMSPAEQHRILTGFNQKYRTSLSTAEISSCLQRLSAAANFNYYSDSRLIAAGGDAKGTLDFYSVHYYDWEGTPLSPFHHPTSAWLLDKPIVVAECALADTYGIAKQDLYGVLYRGGYAGAAAWSWTDESFSQRADILSSMRYLWDIYRSSVDLNGVGSDWAEVILTAPRPDTAFDIGAQIVVQASASVIDNGATTMVEFYSDDTVKIGQRASLPYSILWSNASQGYHTLTAVATGNLGHRSVSTGVKIRVGNPESVRLEAERATIEGDLQNIVVRADASASGGNYLQMKTTTGKITWSVGGISVAGTYPIVFGYRLSFDRPKNQYLNVNGARITGLVFDGAMNTWLEMKQNVPLSVGTNTVQMELSWGWMDLDYVTIPSTPLTSIDDGQAAVPLQFSLMQNYPNPFNPSTTFVFGLPSRSVVSLNVYNIMGQRVAELVSAQLNAGYHSIQWRADVSSGMYFCRIEAVSLGAERREFRKTIKIALLR
jgi:hypothetical protein